MVASQEPSTATEATAQMLTWLNGDLLIQALYTAAALGLADLVADGAMYLHALAEAAGAAAQPLYRLLRMLAGHGVFREDQQGRFSLTPLAATLRRDQPESVRDWVLFVGDPACWSASGGLLRAVRSEESAFAAAHGVAIDPYLSQHPMLSATFDGWMTRQSGLHNGSLVGAYDFSAVHTVVDVGGGQGAMLAAILHANPSLRGILFDLPYVVTSMAPLQEAGVLERCTIAAGDAVAGVPGGGDCYIVKRVLMMESDETAVSILRNCAAVLPADGRVLIIEMLVPPGNTASVSKDFDLRMLVQRERGARIRTEAEFRSLCAAAGLQLVEVIPTASPNSILEAIPA